MKSTLTIDVRWVAADGMYVATCDDMVGLVVQEETLEDCCAVARDFAVDMVREYLPPDLRGDETALPEIDFNITDKPEE